MSTVLRVVAVVAGIATVSIGIALLVRDRSAQAGVVVMTAGFLLIFVGTRSLAARLDRRWLRKGGGPVEPRRQSTAGEAVDVLIGTNRNGGRPGLLDLFTR